jgi:CRISPR-associated protein Cmr5
MSHFRTKEMTMTEPIEEQKERWGRQNIEQERGRWAWDRIREVKSKDSESLEKEYRSLARELNAMIQINGLGQTLGFFKAKGKDDVNKAHYLLLKHLTEWMREQGHFRATNTNVMANGHDGLLRWVTDEGTSSSDYRRATTECLAFGAWLRRFAEAELKEPTPGKEKV